MLRDGTALVFIGIARHLASLGFVSHHTTAALGFVAEGCTAFLLGPVLTVATLYMYNTCHPFRWIEAVLRGESGGRRRPNEALL